MQVIYMLQMKIIIRLRKITPGGSVITFAGSGTAGSTDAAGIAAGFKSPVD